MMSVFPQKILSSELDEHHVLGVSVTSRHDLIVTSRISGYEIGSCLVREVRRRHPLFLHLDVTTFISDFWVI
jgi:hypothetical protein